jgi:hypothetical protein
MSLPTEYHDQKTCNEFASLRRKLTTFASSHFICEIRGQFKCKKDLFFKRRDSCVKRNHFTGSYNISLCVHLLFLSSGHDKFTSGSFGC